MRTLICMRGWPASGKSTFIKLSGLEPWTLCADTIRLQLQGPVLTPDGKWSITQKNDKAVWTTLFEMLEARMDRGELCVIDATHSKASDFAKYKKFIDKYRYRVYAVDFSDVQLESSLYWNSLRDDCKFVPPSVIENMYARIQTQKLPGYVNVIKPNQIDNILIYHPLDFNKWEKIVVIGDIHSCWEPLKQYFIEHPFNEKWYYIFVGDFFDRGIQTKEIFDWWLKNFNRPNFYVLDSNHNIHFHKYAFNDEESIRSKDFLYNTKPKIDEYLTENSLDHGVCRNMCRKVGQMAYFNYGPNSFFVNHGGVPLLPMKLGLVATREFVGGTGKYEDDNDVITTWNAKMSPNEFQIMGHRNMSGLPMVNDRVINLEGKVEFGGHLRIVHLDKSGKIDPLEYKNDVYNKNLTSLHNPAPETPIVANDNSEWVELLRNNKDVYENKYGNISSFNFKRKVFLSGKWSELSKTARALFINNTTNEIVARSYTKFFNINEMPETRVDYLKDNLVFPVDCYIKENGYLGLLGFDSQSNKLIFTSKTSIESDFAGWFYDLFYKDHGDKAADVMELLKNNLCMVFEVIDKDRDPHIIKYDQSKIVLLDMFYRTFKMERVPYEKLQEYGQNLGLEVKKKYVTLYNVEEFTDFISTYYGKQDGGRESAEDMMDGDVLNGQRFIEGVVLEDSGGTIVKLKAKYYNMWKNLRNFKMRLSGGKQVALSKLVFPTENYFYAFIKDMPREKLANLDIITLRDMFHADVTTATSK